MKELAPRLERLHEVCTARDKAHNREFFFDQYAALLLLYFFNPAVTSLRGLQEITHLSAVRGHLGGRAVSLASLSEAGTVFDPEPLREILAELSNQVAGVRTPAQHAALLTLTAVDGSLLPALPRMVWALWQSERHHAAKLHLQFEVARAIPVHASVTAGAESEVQQLRMHLQPGRLYVLDRLYASYRLMADILAARASFIVRVKDSMAFAVQEERPIPPEAHRVGVVRDAILARVGSSHHKREIHQPLRLVEIDMDTAHLLLLADQLDMPAELVALAYRYRWTIELFFRWLKCVLGCRHWLGESLNALTIQVYVGLIASLLLTIWTNRKPNKRTFEMVCHFFAGWATEEELQRYLDQSIKQKSGP